MEFLIWTAAEAYNRAAACYKKGDIDGFWGQVGEGGTFLFDSLLD
jgi:hypothetical protein